jgi:hypothetical protein
MSERIQRLIDRLEALLERAKAHNSRYYCESCRRTVGRRPCEYRHKRRYWSIEEIREVHAKLGRGDSLTLSEMVFIEVFEADS